MFWQQGLRVQQAGARKRRSGRFPQSVCLARKRRNTITVCCEKTARASSRNSLKRPTLGFSHLTTPPGQKLYNGFFRQGWRRGRLFFYSPSAIFWSFFVLIFMMKSKHGILVVKAVCKCDNCSPGGLYCRGFLHWCNKSQSQRLVSGEVNMKRVTLR